MPMKFLKGRPLSILENEDRERIRDANPIEQVVGKYVDLVQKGRVFKGLCPFHDDSNPSMDVDPERGTFKCWACNEGGDVFAFIQKRYNLDFLEAMEHLAQEAGIEFRRRPVDPEVTAQRDKDLEMLEWVTEWFIRQLESQSGKAARENLKKRGFRPDMIRKFRIGFAPPGFDSLTNTLKKAGDPEAAMKRACELGLLKAGREGTYYDAFRDRIIFPIIRPAKGQARETGEVIAFGGRHLGSGVEKPGLTPAKYINSPETRVYSKGKVLYGYHQGLDQIRRGRSLVLSEGYTDVIMAHQYGFGNTVAVLGTALTEEGVQLISRKVDRVDLLFDGDAAGKKAASKCCELFLGTEVEVRVVILESGVDPCDLLSSVGGKEAFESFLAAGISSLEFLIRDILEQHEFEPGVSSMRTVSRVRKELSRRVLEPLSDMGQIPLEEAVRRISVETRWSEASIHQDFLADRDQRTARRRPEGRGSAGRVGPGNFDRGPVPIVEDETEVILGDYGPGSPHVVEPGVEKPADASPGSPEAAHVPEDEHIMIKMVLRDESYYRPLFRIHPPERWRAPLHRELALLVLSERGVPDPEEVSSSGLKSLILDILSFISVEDEMIPDPDERNLLVPQYMAEILVSELERKRHQLVRKGEAREQIQSINDQIQTLTSSKFLFDNPSQVDEIINRFELESLGSTSTQKSEEQESTFHE